MQDLQVPNGYFHLWQIYLSARGADERTLDLSDHEKVQLQYILSLPINAQVPYSFFARVIEKTRQALSCPQLVFEMAEYVRPEHLGVLGYMASLSHTVAEGLQHILRFSRLLIDGDDILAPVQMVHQGRYIYLSWALVDDKYSLLHELSIALLVNLARHTLFPLHLALHGVHFAHSPQMAVFHYQKFYGCDVLFNQPQHGIVFNAESLNLISQQADPALMQLLVKQAEEALASRPGFATIVQRLQLIVAEYLRVRKQAPKIEQIARELNISVRTLQRQLGDADTSFREVLEQERMQRCEQLLHQSLSLTEIAMQLGYSDQSALARAHKAYNGQTLLQRKQLQKRKQQSE
ncbi:AraC family transcriptional regulator ligand-binding domain-containing protein [Acinetobacter sp. WZC-1]|uniref:AraC family transcriptional regulator ligand-binding domain-containing protein n=1 Tax=Acinetobacter sp. WZC-1 TaxID=3459034 RepID=UPI00403E060A